MSIKSYIKAGALVLSVLAVSSLPVTLQAKEILSQEVLAQRVNINSADLAELASLKGIGQQKALAIVAYRDQIGSFNSVDELLNVKGIGEKVLSDIKDKITL